MDETTTIDTAPESSGQIETTGQPPPYTPHETDRGPDSGRTTQTIPTNDVPHPERIGEYDRENILSYGKGAEPEYSFSNAFQSVMSDPGTYLDFMNNVPVEHQRGLEEFAHNIVAHNPRGVIATLIHHGHLPEWAMPEPQRVDARDPYLEDLPPDLRAFVLDNVDPKTWEEYLHLSDDARNRAIERDRELLQMKHQEHQQRSETAVREWNDQLNDFEGKAREDYFKSVSSLQPFEEAAANEQAQDMCVLATWAQVMNDSHLNSLRSLAGEAFRQAAEQRWLGNEKAAKAREADARRLFGIFDAEFKAKLDANIKQFNLFFQHAPGRKQDAPAEQQTYVN